METPDSLMPAAAMTESKAQSTSKDRLKRYARFKAKGSIVGGEFQYLGQSIEPAPL